MIILFLHQVWATEIFMAKESNGTISFTDSPKNENYVLFDVNGPPPKSSNVKVGNFPLLNAWNDYIEEASLLHGVPQELIKAICIAESGMNPLAESHAGAKGLMQLMPATAKDLGVTDIWNPQQNINGGTKYIAQMISMFGDYKTALAAYNAGPGNVRKHKGIPPFEETQIYVERVMDIYALFLREGNRSYQ